MKYSSIQAIDWYLLLPVAVLSIFSLTLLASFDSTLFRSQLFFFIFGCIVFFSFSQTNYAFFPLLSKTLYIISLLVLLSVLLFGVESRGAVRWINFFGVTLQFSEILKPFLSLSLAGFLVSRQSRTLMNFFLSFLLLSPIIALIMLQPDLGNALIFLFVLCFVLIGAGYRLRWFLLLLLPFFLLSPFLWELLHDYQKKRILSFLHPTSDPLGTTYNVTQAIIAIGSGLFLGKGIGSSTQSALKFLPERHTDFIFASLSESFGFVGALVVLFAFGFLFLRIYNLYQRASDDYGKYYLLTTLLFLSLQCFINLGMNLGIIPVVGVTLPFVSYGGSSLLANFIFLGIASSIASKTQNRVLEIK
jgi:rod shape determining protein RodA